MIISFIPKGDLYNALTDRGTFIKILEHGEAELQESEDLRKYVCQDKEYTVEYFMKLKDQINLEEMKVLLSVIYYVKRKMVMEVKSEGPIRSSNNGY
jgi:hypothetical protein